MRSAYIQLLIEQEQLWSRTSQRISAFRVEEDPHTLISPVVSQSKAVEAATAAEAVIITKGPTTEVVKAKTVIPTRPRSQVSKEHM